MKSSTWPAQICCAESQPLGVRRLLADIYVLLLRFRERLIALSPVSAACLAKQDQVLHAPRLAPLRAGLHDLKAPFENVRLPIDTLDLRPLTR
jgi:hypothetical protein